MERFIRVCLLRTGSQFHNTYYFFTSHFSPRKLGTISISRFPIFQPSKYRTWTWFSWKKQRQTKHYITTVRSGLRYIELTYFFFVRNTTLFSFNAVHSQVGNFSPQIINFSKVENLFEGSLDLILSPPPSVKMQIMGGKVCLRCKGKTMLGIVNKLLKTKCLLTSPSNVLPYYLK